MYLSYAVAFATKHTTRADTTSIVIFAVFLGQFGVALEPIERCAEFTGSSG